MFVYFSIFLIFPFVACINQNICNNGVFKCVSSTKLKICLYGKLSSLEFTCPQLTLCSESSQEICTKNYVEIFEKPRKSPAFRNGNNYNFNQFMVPICTDRGEIVIPGTKCKKYVQCIPTANGFVSNIFECLQNEYFDPILRRCSSSYICDTLYKRINIDTNEDFAEYKCQKQGKFQISGTECKKYVLCTRTSTGFIFKTYECPNGSLFDPILKRCTDLYACNELRTSTELTTVAKTVTQDMEWSGVCEDQGRFPVGGTDCKNYVLCTATSNGFISKEYECPWNSAFDPNQKKCSISYVCTDIPVTTVAVSERTTTTAIPGVECKAQGRFPLEGTGCKNYILCTATSNGFISKEYECPWNSAFDPNQKKCSISYICTETTVAVLERTSTSTETPSKTTSIPGVECKAQGRFPLEGTGCKNYILCTATSNGFISKIYECPWNSVFDSNQGKCSISYTCLDISTTTEISTVQTSERFSTEPTTQSTTPSEEKNCTEAGRFPVEGSRCRQYLLCSATSSGFKSKVYDCPRGTLFNLVQRKCTISDNCSETSDTTANSTEKTTTSTEQLTTSTEEPTTSTEMPTTLTLPPTPPPQICKEQGRFAINGTECKKFVLCSSTSNGFVSKVYVCPGIFLFDPVGRKCTNDYKCTDTSTTTISTTSTTAKAKLSFKHSHKKIVSTTISTKHTHSNIISNTTDNTSCITIGRFPKETDTKCKEFYECTATSNKTLKATSKKCKDGFYFDPKDQRCSASYICHRHLHQKVSRRSFIPRFLDQGRCTTVGRFAIPGTNCKGYKLCQALTDGTLTETNFTCPTTTVFNQVIQKCTTAYTCPDTICSNIPFPIRLPNPNVKDCSSYIDCEPIEPEGPFLGTVVYCQLGCYYNPAMQDCDPDYVCPKK